MWSSKKRSWLGYRYQKPLLHLSPPRMPGLGPSQSPTPALSYLTPFHVLHIHGILHALALLLLVLLLLTAALLTNTEAAGEEQEASDHSNSDQCPGWYCPQRGPQKSAVLCLIAPDPKASVKVWGRLCTPMPTLHIFNHTLMSDLHASCLYFACLFIKYLLSSDPSVLMDTAC